MRVFVIGTGRCGSFSFMTACRHITNFTCSHESVMGPSGFPDNHIEVNPHLRFSVVDLVSKYPDSFFVHLVRNRSDCIQSLAALDSGMIMKSYFALHYSAIGSEDPEAIASVYYRDAVSTIDVLLSHCVSEHKRLVMNLESIKDQWFGFWEWIKAEGDFESSIRVWDMPLNTRQDRGEI